MPGKKLVRFGSRHVWEIPVVDKNPMSMFLFRPEAREGQRDSLPSLLSSSSSVARSPALGADVDGWRVLAANSTLHGGDRIFGLRKANQSLLTVFKLNLIEDAAYRRC